MYRRVARFIKGNMHPAAKQFNLRVPIEIREAIESQAKKEKMEATDLTRAILTLSLFPEIMNNSLREEACEWIKIQGDEAFELYFREKIRRLKLVIKNTTYAIKQVEELRQKVVTAGKICYDRIDKVTK